MSRINAAVDNGDLDAQASAVDTTARRPAPYGDTARSTPCIIRTGTRVSRRQRRQLRRLLIGYLHEHGVGHGIDRAQNLPLLLFELRAELLLLAAHLNTMVGAAALRIGAARQVGRQGAAGSVFSSTMFGRENCGAQNWGKHQVNKMGPSHGVQVIGTQPGTVRYQFECKTSYHLARLANRRVIKHEWGLTRSLRGSVDVLNIHDRIT